MKNIIVCIIVAMSLSGCGLIEKEYVTDTPEDHRVRVVLEEDNAFYADKYVAETEAGGDATFKIHEVCGRHVEGTDYRGSTDIALGDGVNEKILTIEDVRYSTVISVKASQEYCRMTYHASGGSILPDFHAEDYDLSHKGMNSAEEADNQNRINADTDEDVGADGEEIIAAETGSVQITVPRTHLRVNTARADELFVRPGYTLIGWSEEPAGEIPPEGKLPQDLISPGSRTDYRPQMDLYAVWLPWTDENLFSFKESGEGVIITGPRESYDLAATNEADYTSPADAANRLSQQTALVIPAQIAGKPVYGIAADAFTSLECQTLVLPVGLRTVGNGAFRGAKFREVCLFDDLLSISGHAFDECAEIRTLHIGAASAPVYSGNYFDTFADKCDRLHEVAEEEKIVLFSGSSTRFGYDSRMIEEELGKKAVNMGVFAYTNALPQLLIIRESMKAGDILLVSPEFDAAQSQFCVRRQMEPQIYAMCESNYDLISKIDLTEVTSVFGAFDTFLKNRIGMEPKSYDIAAADFDEDGRALTTPSYNEFGDYILMRPNAETEEPVYGLGVDYTTAALPKLLFIDPFNSAMEMFLEKEVQVCFTYSPRNVLALSEASTPEARAELDAYLRANLVIPVISDLEESLYTGTYLYGTDNHLSTEGVKIRTGRVIGDLMNMLQCG